MKIYLSIGYLILLEGIRQFNPLYYLDKLGKAKEYISQTSKSCLKELQEVLHKTF